MIESKFELWSPLTDKIPSVTDELVQVIWSNRSFEPINRLEFGDHGLERIAQALYTSIKKKQKIALYADYDVDGTMSCVSWIWFLNAIGFTNYTHHIPCRFSEGYGVNLAAIKHLIHAKHADVIITMDTGITANEEAAYCKEHDVLFICTDHHKIQPEKMPDSLILNPKLNPDARYQELCGAGITFVLLRRLGRLFGVPGDHQIWTDVMALVGMATICDVVPLGSVNHRLAKLGIEALNRSQRPILQKLRMSSQESSGDEVDVGFRLGPRINAVGRLEHADIIISAFIEEDPTELIEYMSECNERRKKIQDGIVKEAQTLAKFEDSSPIVFLGGDWHPGVVGIAAAKIAEAFWKPTWLFQMKDGVCKGSARSIRGFDVTEAMMSCKKLFLKMGGHAAAGGFTFEAAKFDEIKKGLELFARKKKELNPELWTPTISFDCEIPGSLVSFETLERLQELRPFGNSFEEPKFLITGYLRDQTYLPDKITKQSRHTILSLETPDDRTCKRIIFFNRVIDRIELGTRTSVLSVLGKNTFRNKTEIQLKGLDVKLSPEPTAHHPLNIH